MAWIPLHDELYEHPKTRRCARALGEPILVTVARLTLFWLWCMRYAKSGDLTDADVFDVEDAAKWVGEPGHFMDALKESGFVDTYEDGTIEVHDWMEYGGKLIKKQQADLARKKSSTGKKQNSDGIPQPPSTGNIEDSAGNPPEKPEIPVGKTQNSDVRKEKKREEERRREESDPPSRNFSSNPVDVNEPLTRAVLVATDKLVNFEIGSRSPNEATTLAQFLNLCRHKGYTVADVETVREFWPVYLNRASETVEPPTLQQLLSQFDNLLARANRKAAPGRASSAGGGIDELRRKTEELKQAKAKGVGHVG